MESERKMENSHQSNSDESLHLVELTARIVAAYLANNFALVADVPAIISNVHAALSSVGVAPAPIPLTDSPPEPAVPIKKSVTPEYIICLEDGKHFKSMKRHLSVKFGMTPDEYRRRWGLPSDYPMVAAGYSERRSAMALSYGFGRKPKAASEDLDAAPRKKVTAKKAAKAA